jgi:hypothetical protein
VHEARYTRFALTVPAATLKDLSTSGLQPPPMEAVLRRVAQGGPRRCSKVG